MKKTTAHNPISSKTPSKGATAFEEREALRLAKLKQAADQLVQTQLEQSWLQDIPAAPIYRPTAEEWADPHSYIRSIQPEAEAYGICTIRAPLAPAVPAGLVLAQQSFRFGTRQQEVSDNEWEDWDKGTVFWHQGRRYTPREFQTHADEFARKEMGGLHALLPYSTIEASYWKERSSKKRLVVEYGNDLEGTAFHPDDALGKSAWNLNLLPSREGCSLRWSPIPIPGINSPMLYIGMLYSTFCWHVEDHFLCSINYHHAGAAKVWYGVPASHADGFEIAAAASVYKKTCDKLPPGVDKRIAASNALMNKTTMISPQILMQRGVKVFRAVQEVGSYVVTFPRAYHGGFSCGFNIGEAVNFASGNWWPNGENARVLYRRLRRPQVFPHEHALCSDAIHLEDRMFAYKYSSLAAPCAEANMQPSNVKSSNPSKDGQKLSKQEQQERFVQLQPSYISCGADITVMTIFIPTMQLLQAGRKTLEARGAHAVSCCAPGTLAESASILCSRCGHLCYVMSVVPEPKGPHTTWQHTCIHCALDDPMCGPHALMFIKPFWTRIDHTCSRMHIMFTNILNTKEFPLAGKTLGNLLPLMITTYEEPANVLPSFLLPPPFPLPKGESPSKVEMEAAASLQSITAENGNIVPVLVSSLAIPARLKRSVMSVPLAGGGGGLLAVWVDLPSGSALLSGNLAAAYQALRVEVGAAAKRGETAGPWLLEYYNLAADLNAQIAAWRTLQRLRRKNIQSLNNFNGGSDVFNAFAGVGSGISTSSATDIDITNTSSDTENNQVCALEVPWITPHEIWAAATLQLLQPSSPTEEEEEQPSSGPPPNRRGRGRKKKKVQDSEEEEEEAAEIKALDKDKGVAHPGMNGNAKRQETLLPTSSELPAAAADSASGGDEPDWISRYFYNGGPRKRQRPAPGALCERGTSDQEDEDDNDDDDDKRRKGGVYSHPKGSKKGGKALKRLHTTSNNTVAANNTILNKIAAAKEVKGEALLPMSPPAPPPPAPPIIPPLPIARLIRISQVSVAFPNAKYPKYMPRNEFQVEGKKMLHGSDLVQVLGKSTRTCSPSKWLPTLLMKAGEPASSAKLVAAAYDTGRRKEVYLFTKEHYRALQKVLDDKDRAKVAAFVAGFWDDDEDVEDAGQPDVCGEAIGDTNDKLGTAVAEKEALVDENEKKSDEQIDHHKLDVVPPCGSYSQSDGFKTPDQGITSNTPDASTGGDLPEQAPQQQPQQQEMRVIGPEEVQVIPPVDLNTSEMGLFEPLPLFYGPECGGCNPSGDDEEGELLNVLS